MYIKFGHSSSPWCIYSWVNEPQENYEDKLGESTMTPWCKPLNDNWIPVIPKIRPGNNQDRHIIVHDNFFQYNFWNSIICDLGKPITQCKVSNLSYWCHMKVIIFSELLLGPSVILLWYQKLPKFKGCQKQGKTFKLCC